MDNFLQLFLSTKYARTDQDIRSNKEQMGGKVSRRGVPTSYQARDNRKTNKLGAEPDGKIIEAEMHAPFENF